MIFTKNYNDKLSKCVCVCVCFFAFEKRHETPPACYSAFSVELSESQFHVEQWNTPDDEHHAVRNEEGT